MRVANLRTGCLRVRHVAVDTYAPAARSALMSQDKVRRHDGGGALAWKKRLFARGFRYRKNIRGLPGTPDIV